MRTACRLIAISAAVICCTSAVADMEPYNPGVFACGAAAQCAYQDAAAHRTTLLLIRRDALKQQKVDGGTLTPAHLSKLQDRLDAANRIYAHNRELRNSSNRRHPPSGDAH